MSADRAAPLRASTIQADDTAPGEAGSPPIAGRDLRPLGQILQEDGAVRTSHLLKATVMRERQNVRLGEILLAQGWVTEAALTRALTRQWRISAVDPVALAPDSRLIDRVGPAYCLKNAVLPWRRVAGVTFMATARPEDFDALKPTIEARLGPVRMLLAGESRIHSAIMSLRSAALTLQAECSVPAAESCRSRNEGRIRRWTIMSLAALIAAMIANPHAVIALLTGWAALTLLCGTVLRVATFQAALRRRTEEAAERHLVAAGVRPAPELRGPLPVISVLVPLLQESEVAGKLVGRLSRLDYPRELTDILLVVEADDRITQSALKDVRLPFWIRVVTVPPGRVRTKPRALNYALNFCRGEIVGIWDAEDRPDPDQLHRIARGFACAAPDIACLQGQLDYFNPRSNWVARCFTIEYASWFRTNLPGLARLGLVVPLGGTTLFFRRDVLEEIGGWDSWNVTEDADLGVRLARRGWRTELIDTTTDEEANCRLLPWIKQRSRWLKGYAMTWSVHMRDPARLWRELGPRRFLAFQVQFLGTLSQYLLAPVLCSLWLLSFGYPHLMRDSLALIWGGNAVPVLFTLCVASELIALAVNLWSVRGEKHRHLLPYAALMPIYFPLGCVAGWKAIYEVVRKPFYWDKTVHGVFDEVEPAPQADLAESGIARVPFLGAIENGEARGGTARTIRRRAAPHRKPSAPPVPDPEEASEDPPNAAKARRTG
ncbi:Glycosyltransferase, catalytic subunit of cellulose synthase and poly-beta-1,6-N-acetylglucosamine synthase [Paracoccus isoporae]|uniref:Glycosyltransferase, catalytic subunit of cellulose synthase and poly-beta-1,6-N-acetylglucosamine synthase n=1 Tax=Paracoccus isoporae TaxID=591205 RepID=A0A1G6SRQ3_9RHOB|nr:glycosyltransferase [Paracoccus isoporae]SDD19610.1 Glycosyltransferase, catalytic subunit of cellulose synthase and poly-beta-1,6-N-acetylglucosamine synthase [Paracoccus isoporae]